MDVTKVFSPFRLYPNDKEKITEIKFSGYCVNMKIFEDKFDFSILVLKINILYIIYIEYLNRNFCLNKN